jgi:hypothetical protein
MKAHITYDDDDQAREIARIHPASDESVKLVLAQRTGGMDGRSPFVWVRLPNGDLILGVFPQGDTYLACEADAVYRE